MPPKQTALVDIPINTTDFASSSANEAELNPQKRWRTHQKKAVPPSPKAPITIPWEKTESSKQRANT